MSDHLPECMSVAPGYAGLRDCICDRLRAAEQRGFEGTPDIDDRLAAVYRTGYADALDRAREAVAGLQPYKPWGSEDRWDYLIRTDALAAIDALRGES